MTTIPDHYAALGIDPTADQEVITAAYRALAKKFHPDTGTAGGTASAERFDQIQQAYEVLRTPESRHAYDLELLAATEAELQAHIASKRRVAVRAREREAERAAAAPDIDLGDIRPEPATPPRGTAGPAGRKPRSLFPFIVPLLLMSMIGGAAAWMFLPAGPEAPPLPGVEQQDVAEAPPAPQPATTAAKVDQPAPPPQTASADAEAPVFGSAAVDGAPQTKQVAATPEPASAPATSLDDGAATPVFGSSAGESGSDADGASATPQDTQAPAAPPEAAPPVPKAKPSQPVKQAQKPAAAKPAQKQAQPVQKQPQQQPRARLAYQDPPAYYPEPDGYPPPPPGMEPPGFEPDDMGYDTGDLPPPGYRPPGRGPYRLVIFERQPGRQATAWSAGVVFKSMGKCTKQGVKAVLRRTAGMDPYADDVRVWYECQQLSQR